MSPEVALMQSSPVNQKRAFQIHAFVFVATFLPRSTLWLGAPYWITGP